MWVLIESGVLGDDRRKPQPSAEALGIIFDGLTNLVDLEVTRSLGGPVEWSFSDADPWHLVVTNGHSENRAGWRGRRVAHLRDDRLRMGDARGRAHQPIDVDGDAQAQAARDAPCQVQSLEALKTA